MGGGDGRTEVKFPETSSLSNREKPVTISRVLCFPMGTEEVSVCHGKGPSMFFPPTSSPATFLGRLADQWYLWSGQRTSTRIDPTHLHPSPPCFPWSFVVSLSAPRVGVSSDLDSSAPVQGSVRHRIQFQGSSGKVYCDVTRGRGKDLTTFPKDSSHVRDHHPGHPLSYDWSTPVFSLTVCGQCRVSVCGPTQFTQKGF